MSQSVVSGTVWAAILLTSVAGCLSAARRSSGAIGCAEEDITITDESVGVFGDHTWTAVCHGKTYYCSMNAGEEGAPNVNCTPADSDFSEPGEEASEAEDEGGTQRGRSVNADTESQAAAKPPQEPPTKAAGFDFGASPADAAKACTDAAGRWQDGDSEGNCSKAPMGVGFDGRVVVSYCERKVCRVTALQDEPDEKALELRRSFIKIVDLLLTKYGKPKRAFIALSPKCRADLAGCLRAKEERQFAQWVWPNGFEIKTGLVPREQRIMLVLIYRSSGLSSPGAEGL